MTETRNSLPSDGGHSVTLSYNLESAVAKITLGSPASPTFGISTLDAFQAAIDKICSHNKQTTNRQIKYFILASSKPGLFSMGGDLQTIARLASERNLLEAMRFAHQAARIIFSLWNGFGLELVTTACVSGKAYGAGFEAALACNRIVAQRRSTFCLPEQRFGLFPGMGATSLLERRLGRSVMEDLIEHQTILTAEQAYENGLIDIISDEDSLEAELSTLNVFDSHRWSEQIEVQRTMRIREAFSLDEVMATTTQWAQAVVDMSPENLHALLRVAHVQSSRNKARIQ